jgi:hypothetical protein
MVSHRRVELSCAGTGRPRRRLVELACLLRGYACTYCIMTACRGRTAAGAEAYPQGQASAPGCEG